MTLHSSRDHTGTTTDLGLDSQPSRTSEAEVPGSQKQIQNSVGYSEYIVGLDLEFTDAEARRTRWKIDLVIIPIFLITQALQHMCRTTLNYVNLFGYQEVLELHGRQFSYLTSMVYVGYFLGQYPCGWLIGRFPAQKVLTCGVLGMGLSTILMTQCRTFGSALAVRFLVGIFTASVTPGLTLMTGFWFTRREIPLRQCVWFSAVGWGGILGSYIAMGVSKLPAGMHERWQLIFYIMGGATCLWAFVVLSFLPDNPSAARFLSPRERIIAVSRVAANESGIKNKHLDKKQAMLSFYDLKTLLVSISIFAGSFPHAVVTSFSTVIIRDMGFSTTRTTALKSVGDAVQVVTLLMGGAVILKIRHSRLLTAATVNVLCAVSAALMAYLSRSNQWGRLVCFWLVNSQSLSYTIGLTMISSNMAGYTHKSFASAMIFTANCWGSFSGPLVVKQSEAPYYRSATIGLMVGYLVKLVSNLLLLAYMFFVNRHRDHTYGAADKQQSDEAGMQDKTEFENKNFRYVL